MCIKMYQWRFLLLGRSTEWELRCVNCRQTESRRVAVSGFLMLLNNFNSLAGNFMSSQSASQSASQLSCVGSSQVHRIVVWVVALTTGCGSSIIKRPSIYDLMKKCWDQATHCRQCFIQSFQVALHWAQLVLGWVIVFGQVYHLDM